MKYEKPEITRVESAIDTIQSVMNKTGGPIDSLGQVHFVTAATYESDE
jgi:hypothetical protein